MKKDITLLLAFLGMVIGLQAQIPTDGLVAHYTFDNTPNDAASGYNLTSSGRTYGVGEIENAFLFTGTEECYSTDVNFRRVFDNTNSWSVSMWYNSSVPYNEATGFGTNAKMLFACDGVNSSPYKRTWIRASELGIHLSRMLGSGNGVELVAEYNFLPNIWYHISLNYDGNNTTVYINGSLLDYNFTGDIVQDIGSVDANTERVTIGGNRQDNVIQWKGLIDQTYVYNRTLTSEEVKGVYEESGRSVLDEGLVAYYPFNGNANDESGNNLHGTVDSATLISDRFGIPNSSYSFNKSNITVQDNDLLDFTNQFSLCVWYKSDSVSTYLGQGIMGKLREEGGGRYGIQLANPGDLYGVQPDFPKIIFGINNSQSGGNCHYHSDGLLIGWHFVVGTYDGQNIKLYFDGDLVDTQPTSVILPVDNTPLYIGRESGGIDSPVPSGETIRFFFGEIDDVRIFNRPISQDEISLLYYENKCFEIVYDTTYITINDTITTEIFDTTFVTVYDSIAVTDTLIIDVTITGINPPDNLNTIKIYPNPAKDLIFIHSGNKYENMTDYSIKIINTTGITIFESNVTQQLFEIDVSDFGQTGLYFIQIIDNSSQIIDVRKIILE